MFNNNNNNNNNNILRCLNESLSLECFLSEDYTNNSK